MTIRQRIDWLIPGKKWFVVWGGHCWTCTPFKTKKWVWLGEPLDWFFNGCGPFTDGKIDEALSKFI